MTVPLSVIVSTDHRTDQLQRCLASLQKVTVPNFEIIVADKGDTLSQARNQGFEASHGKYVGFLDCDDEWIPEVIEKAVAWLDSHPEVDVLFAEATVNQDDGPRSWIALAGQEAFFNLPHTDAGAGFRILERGPFFHRMAERNAVFIGACIMRREAFAESGMF